ncbi:MAG TPA: hypothetical protein VHL98_11230 [Microvirga sp.]|jgi:hypothetical protein|nr:hypothetical protein [Microvirga sp.]
MHRRLGVVIGLGALLLPHAAPGRDGADRPAIVADLERRFPGRFLFTTSGDGVFAVYQRVERPADIGADQDPVCLLGACYVPVDTVPGDVLRRAGTDPAHADGVRRSFKAGQDAYERALRAPAPEREAAQGLWRAHLVGIGRCLRDRSAC